MNNTGKERVITSWELLAPARDMECVDAAIRFGADAVYIGGPMMQLRAASSGFQPEAISIAAGKLHSAGKRLYVAVNVFAKNAEIAELPNYAKSLRNLGVDALIVSDLGAIACIRQACPDIEIHVSTQANCLNYAAANVYASMGASRVVLGREMTLREIRELRENIDPNMHLEAFVHGSMCMAYSGRCMISAALTGRSANRGACTQSCRWNYALMEEKRPGQYFPVFEDERGMSILSSNDLCTLPFLDQLLACGISSCKIEGRMKSAYYVATVTNAYRRRLDAIKAQEASDIDALMRELSCVSHRAYSSGFYFSEAIHAMPDAGVYEQECIFTAIVTEFAASGRVCFEARNRLEEGTTVEVLSPHLLGARFIAENITDASGKRVSCADRPSERYEMDCPYPLEPGDILRVRLAHP